MSSPTIWWAARRSSTSSTTSSMARSRLKPGPRVAGKEGPVEAGGGGGAGDEAEAAAGGGRRARLAMRQTPCRDHRLPLGRSREYGDSRRGGGTCSRARRKRQGLFAARALAAALAGRSGRASGLLGV